MSQVAKSLNESVLFVPGGSRRLPNLVDLAAFAATAGLAIGVMIYFHDRSWWPPDDGAYAHVAERVLNGEVLNRDIQDLHFGLVNLTNALWLRLFGLDLVSLRYPLAVMTVAQVCVVFWLMIPKGLVLAASGAMAMSALSLVQFLNPTAHWYCLFLLVVIAWAMSAIRGSFRLRLELLGFLIVAMMLYRQLSGAFVAIAVLAYLLCEDDARAKTTNPILARVLILLMGLAIVAYLAAKADLTALAIFGVGPLGALAWAFYATRKSDAEALRLVVRLAFGGAVGALPLFLYHAANGSILAWIDDTIFAAVHLTELSFMSQQRYWIYPMLGLSQVLSAPGFASVVNGLYVSILPVLPLVLGVALSRGLFKEGVRGSAFHPIVFLSAFYALVSVHYQIPIYLYYSTATTVIGLLILSGGGAARLRCGAAALAFALSACGLWYHAGQPVSRGAQGVAKGERMPLVAAQGIALASLWMTNEDNAAYGEILTLIEQEVPEDRAILSLPFNPELYFLSGRRNPTRFFNSALGVRNDRDYRAAIVALEANPPVLVFHDPDDKYNTAMTARILEYVTDRYDALKPRHGLNIFRIRPNVKDVPTQRTGQK